MAILDSINSKYFSKDIRQYCCRCNVKKYSVFLFILIGTISFAVGNLSCDVTNVNIGFYPSNLDWESDEFHIGLWSYRQMRGAPINPASLVSSYMNEQMGPECSAFTNMMESMFFDGDKIWRIIRLASLAALISGAIALLVITCSCCCSIPIDIIWHSLLLPTVSSSLFIGSIVFTMPTIKLCSNRVWQPSGSEYTPTKAKNCSFGANIFAFIVAELSFLFCFILLLQDPPSVPLQTVQIDDTQPITNDEPEIHPSNEKIQEVDQESLMQYSMKGYSNEVSSVSDNIYSSNEFSTKNETGSEESYPKASGSLNFGREDQNDPWFFSSGSNNS